MHLFSIDQIYTVLHRDIIKCMYNSPYIHDELNKTTDLLNETLILDSEDDEAIEESRSPLHQSSRR